MSPPVMGARRVGPGGAASGDDRDAIIEREDLK
jgi:hypothetical protein